MILGSSDVFLLVGDRNRSPGSGDGRGRRLVRRGRRRRDYFEDGIKGMGRQDTSIDRRPSAESVLGPFYTFTFRFAPGPLSANVTTMPMSVSTFWPL